MLIRFIKMGIKAAVTVVEWFEILEKNHERILGRTLIFTSNGGSAEIPPEMTYMTQTKIGYTFQREKYFLQAFTGLVSAKPPGSADYKPLKRIGDGLIIFLVELYIFNYCGELYRNG